MGTRSCVDDRMTQHKLRGYTDDGLADTEQSTELSGKVASVVAMLCVGRGATDRLVRVHEADFWLTSTHCKPFSTLDRFYIRPRLGTNG
ncbi:hypothetical protein WN48_08475 [Eufriesea mexicana]|nr:hypothetical protein WN48_08475 [Eufriesea mexicana]